MIKGFIRIGEIVCEPYIEGYFKFGLISLAMSHFQHLRVCIQSKDFSLALRLLCHNCQGSGATAQVQYALTGLDLCLLDEAALVADIPYDIFLYEVVKWRQN